MKKVGMIVTVAVIGILFVVGSIYAGGHKYRKTPYEPPASGEEASSESVTSMSDCMTFSANHKSKGPEADKTEFKRQFGAPMSEAASAITYNYDKYTNVVLKCSARKCDCMCLTKY